MDYNPSIAIIGSGAVGGYYGGRLAQHGQTVHFLLRSDFEAWRTQGLRIKSIDGDFALSPRDLRVYNSPAAMPKVDLVIVTLKTTENRHVKDLIIPLLHDDTTILTLQNGMGNEQSLADHFGESKIVGGLAFTCINRIEAGLIDHSGYGHIRLGEFTGPGKSPRAERIAALFRDSKVRAETVDDLKLARWDKQVWNIPFNGLSTLIDVTTDRLIADDAGTNLVRAVMNEVLEAAAIDGVQLASQTPEQKIAATRAMGPYLTSTQIDRRSRKPMEIESIFGHPVHRARAAGKQLMLLEMIYFALKQIDANQSDKMGKISS